MNNKQQQEGWRWGVLAFFLTLIGLIATCQNIKGQTVGVNGAGFFENRSEQSDEWLIESVGSERWMLRVPGGAIAKYQKPDPSKGGWGLDSSFVYYITTLYKSFDEEQTEDVLGKWYRKTAQQPEYSYLDDLIQFNTLFDSLEVIYAVNVFVDPATAIFPVEYLLLNGVNIVGVEMGNETYSQLDHDFVEYKTRVDQIAPLVRALGLTVYHPAAPSGTRYRPDHNNWNGLLAVNYPGDGVTFHPYFDRREFSGLSEPVDTALTLEQIASFDWDAFWGDLRADFPLSGSYIVTETNSQPARFIGGSELNAVLVDSILSSGRRNLDVICLHNGVSPDIYGIIWGKEGKQVKNTTFDVWVNNVKSEAVEIPECYEVKILRPECERCDRFWYWLFNFRKCGDCRESPYIYETICN